MNDKKVYEVVDYTDETYYPLGIFNTMYQAQRAIQRAERPDSPLSEWASEEYERIVIVERNIGWSDSGRDVLEIQRESYYDEKEDEYYWKRINKTHAPAFPESAGQLK